MCLRLRDFFVKRDGFLVDNPLVGPTLTKHMWAPGNSQPFLHLVEELTGKPLSGGAWVAELSQNTEALLAAEQTAYFKAVAERKTCAVGEEVNLNMRVRLVDGDEVIADSSNEEGGGSGFLSACAEFECYLQKRFTK
jgi:hypothetical protein